MGNLAMETSAKIIIKNVITIATDGTCLFGSLILSEMDLLSKADNKLKHLIFFIYFLC